MSRLRVVAESGGLMPQKSTYFHPKLATGMAIYSLRSGRDPRIGEAAEEAEDPLGLAGVEVGLFEVVHVVGDDAAKEYVSSAS